MAEISTQNGQARPAKRSKTRTALLSAGWKLFAQHPADAVSIDDIVNEAGVAKGSFYNHFPDKDSLLDAIVTSIRERIEAKVVAINADIRDPAARVARGICMYAASVREQPADGLVLLRNDQRASVHRALNEGLKSDIREGLHSGRLLLPSIDAGQFFVIGVVHGLLLSAVRRQDNASALSDAQQICMLMLRAFGLPHTEAELISAQATDEIIRERPHRSQDN